MWPLLDLRQADVPECECRQDLEQGRGPLVVREHIAWMGNQCEVFWALRPAWQTGSRCSSHPRFHRRDVHPVETRGACTEWVFNWEHSSIGNPKLNDLESHFELVTRNGFAVRVSFSGCGFRVRAGNTLVSNLELRPMHRSQWQVCNS